MITPPQPGPGIRGFQKRGSFHFAQELHCPSFEALWRDGQNTLTVIGEGGFVNGNVPEEGMYCAQAVIASASAVVAIVLKVLEECGHEFGIQIARLPKQHALSAPPSFVSDVCFVSAVSFVSTCADKICGTRIPALRGANASDVNSARSIWQDRDFGFGRSNQ